MKKIKCTIARADTGSLAATPDLIVNGRNIQLPIGREAELEVGTVEAAEASDAFIVTRLDDSSPAAKSGGGDDAAAQPGGSDAGGVDTPQKDDAPDATTTDIMPEGGETAPEAPAGQEESVQGEDAPDATTTDVVPADTFDAAAVLDGTLKDVTPRIEALETIEQVQAVRKAAGPNARKGTKDALNAREAALKGEA